MKILFEDVSDIARNEVRIIIIQTLDEIIEQTIPIYTLKRPNPKSGKEDCPVTVKEKEGFRMMMRIKLEAAKTDTERQSIIDKYKKMFE